MTGTITPKFIRMRYWSVFDNFEVKEVGAAKTKRAQARVTVFCRNSRKEYIGNFILHSYASNGPVNREETEQFLRKQILEPMECYVPAESVLASPKPAR